MKTIEYLRKYNEWRRGADTEHPDPIELGQQIDAAIGAMVMLEETAKLAVTLKKERDEAQAQNAKLRDIAARASEELAWWWETKAQQLRAELDSGGPVCPIDQRCWECADDVSQ